MFVGVGRLRAMGHGGRALRMNMFMFLDEALDFLLFICVLRLAVSAGQHLRMHAEESWALSTCLGCVQQH